MPRPRSEAKQLEKIRHAGQLMFMRLGYQRTTISAIAKAAGISKATIYLHFPSKEALFCAIVEEHAEGIARSARREVKAAVGFHAKVEAFFRARLRGLGQLEGIDQLSREVFLEMVQRADVALQRVFERECRELTQLLEAGHAAGELVVERPHLLAQAMTGALRAINLEAVYLNTDERAQQAVQQIVESVEALLEVIMRGLTPLERLAGAGSRER